MGSRGKIIGSVVAAAVVVVGIGTWITVRNIQSHKQASIQAIQTSKLLGITYTRIVSELGKPSTVIQSMKDGVGMFLFEKGNVTVSFEESHSYLVNYTLSKPVSLDEAQSWAKHMIPSDSTFVKTRSGNTGQPVDVYQSTGLSSQFGQEIFSDQNGQLHPGYFDVSYIKNKQGLVNEVDFSVGDNA